MTTFGPDDILDDFIEHYGIKGMRWGVRRSPKTIRLGRVSRPSKTGEQGGVHKPSQTGEQGGGQKKGWNERRKERNAQIKDARAKVSKILVKEGSIPINHPDLQMSRKSTTGEKVAIGLLTGTVGALFIADRNRYSRSGGYRYKH
jgi:hypothetical protein